MRIATNVCRWMLPMAMLGALAYGQAVVTDDAYASSSAPTTNYGNVTDLMVCQSSVVGCKNVNSYIKFSLAGLGPGVNAANVAKATLILYTDTVLTTGKLDVRQVAGSW